MNEDKPLFVALGLEGTPAVIVLRGAVTNMNAGASLHPSVAVRVVELAGKSDWDLAMGIAKHFCGVVAQEKKVVYGLTPLSNNHIS